MRANNMEEWRTRARAFFEKYAETLKAADWFVETFEELEEAEVEAIIAGLQAVMEEATTLCHS